MSIRDLDVKRRRKSLDQLEGEEWGPPAHNSSLVITCHRLRTKPIGEFSPGDLRIMIGQQIGLMFLVPLALELLEGEPLVEATFFPGDLLGSVLRVPSEFWQRHTDLRSRLDAVIAGLCDVPSEVIDDLESYRGSRSQGVN